METQLKKNEYDGNGWTRYQKLVLDQLDDHKELLKSIVGDINEIKQEMAVTSATRVVWCDSTDRSITELKNDVKYILHDEKGVNQRLKTLEDSHKISEGAKMKFNAMWGFIGGGLVIVFDIVYKIYSSFHP